jgi:pantetheine-phosphate adenylyltransferase
MSVAVYPGSFDPITLGHLDIIRRIQSMLGSVTVLIAQNPAKKYLFTAEERKQLAIQALKGMPGIKVDIHQGLTVDYLRKMKARVIIRGLRAVTDFEYEFVMANMNKKLAPKIETMIVFASPEFYYVSSNTVKEVALNGGSVKDLVPVAVNKALNIKRDEFRAANRLLAKSAAKQAKSAAKLEKSAAKNKAARGPSNLRR